MVTGFAKKNGINVSACGRDPPNVSITINDLANVNLECDKLFPKLANVLKF